MAVDGREGISRSGRRIGQTSGTEREVSVGGWCVRKLKHAAVEPCPNTTRGAMTARERGNTATDTSERQRRKLFITRTRIHGTNRWIEAYAREGPRPKSGTLGMQRWSLVVLAAWRLRRGFRHLCVWTGLPRPLVRDSRGAIASPELRGRVMSRVLPFLPHLSSAIGTTTLEEDAASRMQSRTCTDGPDGRHERWHAAERAATPTH